MPPFGPMNGCIHEKVNLPTPTPFYYSPPCAFFGEKPRYEEVERCFFRCTRKWWQYKIKLTLCLQPCAKMSGKFTSKEWAIKEESLPQPLATNLMKYFYQKKKLLSNHPFSKQFWGTYRTRLAEEGCQETLVQLFETSLLPKTSNHGNVSFEIMSNILFLAKTFTQQWVHLSPEDWIFCTLEVPGKLVFFHINLRHQKNGKHISLSGTRNEMVKVSSNFTLIPSR